MNFTLHAHGALAFFFICLKLINSKTEQASISDVDIAGGYLWHLHGESNYLPDSSSLRIRENEVAIGLT